jgi:serine/threonine protein kinase/tetratricopeptide (TPR) repeat protein
VSADELGPRGDGAPEVDALAAELADLLDLAPARRLERLAEVADPTRRAALTALLDAALDEDDFLSPGGALRPDLLDEALGDDDDSLAPGTELGAYRIVEEIGEGGMGRVYLGERADGLFERRVAIKVVHADHVTADLDRLRREQQILAELVHPHIAQLYDAGLTAGGSPYLVMEHVAGEAIDEHCRRRALGARDRLRLLVDVCAAVATAHQRLIVHRDLKPSNILVDVTGSVKLLDFGIARILDAEGPAPAAPGGAEPPPHGNETIARSPTTTFAHGRSWLTPQYASPEQLAGLPLTTSSDVFQLGLLAWELLAGRRPSRLDSAVDGAAAPLGALPLASAGAPASDLPLADVDAVVSKALAPAPGDRYLSADRLGEDLQNLLAGRPVQARPRRRAYVFRRFLGRHRLAAAATAGATTLVVGLTAAFTARLASERDATRLQAAEAERARLETEQVVDFLTGLFRSTDPYAETGGKNASELSARELLDRSARRLENALEEQPLVRARLLAELGGIYRQLGLLDSAEPLLRESLRLRESTPGVRAVDVAESRLSLGRQETQRGRFDEAASLLDRAVADFRTVGERRGLAAALEARGNLAQSRGEPGAIDAFEESLALWRELGVVEREADLRLFLANAHGSAGRVAEARAQREAALALVESRFGPSHPSVATALVGIADLHKLEGNQRLSLPLLERALGIFETSFGPDDHRVAAVANNLGVAYSDLGEHATARPYLERALVVYQKERADHPDAGEILNNLGTIDWSLGRPASAATLYRRALEQLRRTLPEDHLAISRTVFNLGEALFALGRKEEAKPLLEQSLANLGAKLGGDHVMLSWPQLYLASIAESRGELDLAESLLRRAVELREAAAGLDPNDVAAAREALDSFQLRHHRARR